MPRTVVVSDLHGFGALLENALADAAFGGDDRLIVAGDLVDAGPDDCVAAAQRRGATILAGNHEVAAALGVDIWPQNPDTPAKGPEFAERILSGEWPLATAVSGWLVSHAGVSTLFEEDIRRAGGEAERLAAGLNARFREEIEAVLTGARSVWRADELPVVGSDLGPLWFRPSALSQLAAGLKQIAGHTPPELYGAAGRAALAERNLLLIDPGARLSAGAAGRFRYAVIEEDGTAQVKESGPELS